LTLSTKIPPVGTVEDQHLHELIENYPVRDPRSVATERMIYVSFGQKDDELFLDILR
jgi:hypothetical protein